MIIRRLVKLLTGRRAPPKAEPKAVVPKTATPPKAVLADPISGEVLIWESEVRAIALETAAWTVETGGDLFGRWLDKPIIFLATKAGPKAQRDNAHFRLDVDYLRDISGPLVKAGAIIPH